MKNEFETKVLEIDVPNIKQKLKEIGATEKIAETLQKRFVGDVQ
jgi:hypothetical protein